MYQLTYGLRHFQTFAGVISLLNDFRLSQGKSPLGFLNPLIYSTGAAGFNDITSGSNPGCSTNGFTAGTGWDPVSISLASRPAPFTSCAPLPSFFEYLSSTTPCCLFTEASRLHGGGCPLVRPACEG